MFFKTHTTLWTLYKLFVWILLCLIVSLWVSLYLVKDIIHDYHIHQQQLIESYGELQLPTYWWENSNVWGFKSHWDLSLCSDFFTLNSLQSSMSLPCIPQSVPETQKFPGMKLLWIDATFANDSVDFIDSREYFTHQWAKLYLTQSPWRFPWSWVLRTSSKFIFNNKKILYIFYNERNKIKNYKKDQLIHELKKQFPHLDDVRVHSFFYYKKVMWEDPFNSDLGKIMYYVGDCNLPEHNYCNKELLDDWKYQSFTNDFISSDLDFFFIVPAVPEVVQQDSSRSWWPVRFLQWLFKSSN